MKNNEDHLTRMSETMRLYGDMRFKQLTLFLAWLALAGAGVVYSPNDNFIGSLSLRAIVSIGSMAVTATLWVMEVKSSLYWAAIRDEFPKLWPRPKRVFLPFLSATNMVFVFYCLNYVFWWWCSFRWDINVPILVIFGIIGCLILAFSVTNYWRTLWFHKENQGDSQTSEIPKK
jgi:hypothetical protein